MTPTTARKPAVGDRVQIVETYHDGTRITAEGVVTHHEPGVDHFVYIGNRRYTMLWQPVSVRQRADQAVGVDVTYLCDVCGKPATTDDGMVDARLCDSSACLATAWDRASKPA